MQHYSITKQTMHRPMMNNGFGRGLFSVAAGLSVFASLPSFGADSRPAPVVEAADRVQIRETVANGFDRGETAHGAE